MRLIQCHSLLWGLSIHFEFLFFFSLLMLHNKKKLSGKRILFYTIILYTISNI